MQSHFGRRKSRDRESDPTLNYSDHFERLKSRRHKQFMTHLSAMIRTSVDPESETRQMEHACTVTHRYTPTHTEIIKNRPLFNLAIKLLYRNNRRAVFSNCSSATLIPSEHFLFEVKETTTRSGCRMGGYTGSNYGPDVVVRAADVVIVTLLYVN